MREKINVAELLKDCPKGMELDCATYEKVEFDYIEQSPESKYPIHCLMRINGGCNALVFTHNGCNDRHPNAKCVIFPKGKTTWEGFVPPIEFKNGDVIYTKNVYDQEWCSILNNCEDGKLYSYADFCINRNDFYCNKPNVLCECKDITEHRRATKEEKEKLFKAIKDNGYKWNPEAKVLEKLIEPKFKVGDKIRHKENKTWGCTIKRVADRYYVDGHPTCFTLLFEQQNEYELVPNKFDINTLIPFESRVLVRDNDYDEWKGAFWSHLRQKADIKYDTIRGAYRQCIPYNDDTKHLLGKTNSCDEYFKNWK